MRDDSYLRRLKQGSTIPPNRPLDITQEKWGPLSVTRGMRLTQRVGAHSKKTLTLYKKLSQKWGGRSFEGAWVIFCKSMVRILRS